MDGMMQGLANYLQNREAGLMDAGARFAVLVPLVEREDGFHVLYEVRALTLRRQPGEVCFPGGKIDGRETPEECAIRETREELGIPASAIQVLGRLDFIAHRSNFIMYPILALVDWEAVDHMEPNRQEVDHTFEVPLTHLLTTQPLEYEYKLIPETDENFPYELIGIHRDYRWRTGGENVPVYPWEGRAIWGLTGRITRHLTRVIHGLIQ